MTGKLSLSLACAPYDRTQPLFDKRVEIEGVDLTCHPMQTDRSFTIAYSTRDYDITELSASSHMLTVARGDAHYVAVPAFVSRVFRHSSIYIRTDRGIKSAADLKGRTIGVPQYQMTAALWARGLLSDEYGVESKGVTWRTGGLDKPGGGERTPLDAPDFSITPIGPTETLSALLADGTLDAIMASRAPRCFTERAPNIARMFPDYRADEEAYYRKTGLFPIMHTIGIRRSLVEQHPWLAPAVFRAFSQSLDIAIEQLHHDGAYYATLPWLPHDLSRVETAMGKDFWPYGIAKNKPALDAMLRWSVEQGLSKRVPSYDELFAPGCLD